jgi:hypothetical protein
MEDAEPIATRQKVLVVAPYIGKSVHLRYDLDINPVDPT